MRHPFVLGFAGWALLMVGVAGRVWFLSQDPESPPMIGAFGLFLFMGSVLTFYYLIPVATVGIVIWCVRESRRRQREDSPTCDPSDTATILKQPTP